MGVSSVVLNSRSNLVEGSADWIGFRNSSLFIGFSCYRTIDSFTRVSTMVRKELLIIRSGSSCCHGYGFCKTLFGNICATGTLNLQVPGTPVESTLEENSIKELVVLLFLKTVLEWKIEIKKSVRRVIVRRSFDHCVRIQIPTFRLGDLQIRWIEKIHLFLMKCVRLGTIRMLA